MGDNVVSAAWSILKGSLRVEPGDPVNVLMGDTLPEQVNKGPVSFTEYYDRKSGMFGETITELAIVATWMYDGTSIVGFTVDCTDGFVDMGSSVDVAVKVGPSRVDSGVARLPYRVVVTFDNITGGSKRTVISAEAGGDGGGRSLLAPA
jgi:hypothetical protein